MNKKFYVSLEVARLLKEKGYNKETEYTIDNNGHIWMGEYRDEYDFPCPTRAEVIDWLDKKVIIGIGYSDLFSTWHYDITPVIPGTKAINNLSFSTRLEAEEAAIIEVLTEFL